MKSLINKKTSILLTSIVLLSIGGQKIMAQDYSTQNSSNASNASMSSNQNSNVNQNNNANQTDNMNANQNDNMQQYDAISIILADHQRIGDMINLLNQNLDSDITKSRAIFKDLTTFIKAHEAMEEEVFYPALDQQKDLKSIISDLKKQESAAGNAIVKINGIKDDTQWKAGVKMFIEAVKKHANDEETKLFPQVKNTFSLDQLNQIGSKMIEYRKSHPLPQMNTTMNLNSSLDSDNIKDSNTEKETQNSVPNNKNQNNPKSPLQ